MNRLGLGYGAIGWATDASPDDIAILTPAKAKELGIDVTVLELDNKQANAQPIVPPVLTTPHPVAPQYVKPAPTPSGIEEPSECRATGFRKQCCPGDYAYDFVYGVCHWRAATDPRNRGDDHMCERAQTAVTDLITSQLMQLTPRSTYYADVVNYYGAIKDRATVMNEIKLYTERWPRRTYKITSINWYGNNTMCGVYGEVAFEAESTTKKSVGTATFEYGLENQGDGRLLVTAESSKVLTRQITDIASQADRPLPQPTKPPPQPAKPAPAAKPVRTASKCNDPNPDAQKTLDWCRSEYGLGRGADGSAPLVCVRWNAWLNEKHCQTMWPIEDSKGCWDWNGRHFCKTPN
jgi:hypothetical protein